MATHGGKRPNSGRKGYGERATLQVRVSPEILAQVREDCGRTGEEVSEYVRQAVIERLERRRGMREEIEECAHCGRDVTHREAVPRREDEEAWEEIAGEHADGCEWVTTRAFTTPERV